MSKHSIDRILRQKLHDQEAKVSESTWQALEARIPRQNSDRRIAWWVWAAGGAVFLLLMAIFLTKVLLPHGEQQVDSTPALDQAIENLRNAAELENMAKGNMAEQSASPPESTITPDQSESTSLSAKSKEQSSALKGPSVITQQLQSLAPVTRHAVSPFVTTEQTNDHAAVRVSSKMDINLPAIATNMFIPKHKLEARLPTSTDCYQFQGGLTGTFFLDAYAGPSWQFRTLTSRGEDVSEYITARDTTESLRLSMNAGIRISYYLPNGLFARVGAHYTQVNELFDFVNERSTQTIITIDSIFDGSGDFVRVDTNTTVTTGTRVKKTYNRFHAVDIPILLGYQLERGDWSYGIQAGPVLNIAFVDKGDILSPAGVPGSFSDASDPDYHPVFRNRLGIGVYGAAYIQRRVGEKLYVFAEPHILHRFQSMTLDNYPIDQRQSVAGLALGIRLKL